MSVTIVTCCRQRVKCKNRQKIPIPRKMPAESKSRVKYPSKNVNLCLFYASEQAKPLKKATGCVSHLSRAQHFSPHPGGRVGWQWGVGGKLLNRVKIHSLQKCGRLFADCWPHRPLSIFALNKRCRILNVDAKKCFKKIKIGLVLTKL